MSRLSCSRPLTGTWRRLMRAWTLTSSANAVAAATAMIARPAISSRLPILLNIGVLRVSLRLLQRGAFLVLDRIEDPQRLLLRHILRLGGLLGALRLLRLLRSLLLALRLLLRLLLL